MIVDQDWEKTPTHYHQIDTALKRKHLHAIINACVVQQINDDRCRLKSRH